MKNKYITASIFLASIVLSVVIYIHKPEIVVTRIDKDINGLDAVVEVSKVFGRSISQACRNTDPQFVSMVADKSLKAGVRPGLAASVIDQESGCDQYAVSPRGAAGEMQIMLKVWQTKFDFSQRNPFNKENNIEMGCAILADLVNQYGEKEALRRYQGLGVGGNPNYVSDVIKKEKP